MEETTMFIGLDVHKATIAVAICRRKIEMSPGVQSRDDTPGDGRAFCEMACRPIVGWR
jgi:hypothetical protein